MVYQLKLKDYVFTFIKVYEPLVFFSLLLELYIMMKDINNQCLENNDLDDVNRPCWFIPIINTTSNFKHALVRKCIWIVNEDRYLEQIESEDI